MLDEYVVKNDGKVVYKVLDDGAAILHLKDSIVYTLDALELLSGNKQMGKSRWSRLLKKCAWNTKLIGIPLRRIAGSFSVN